MNANSSTLPSTLHHENTEKTSSSCYAVNWTEDGRVLCAINTGVEVRSNCLEIENTILLPNHTFTFSAKIVGDNLYTHATSEEDKKYFFYAGSLEQPIQRVIHSVGHETPTKITHLSVNKNHLASIDLVNKVVKIFSTMKHEHILDISLAEMKHPYSVHIISDGVLITEFFGDQLCKYGISPSSGKLWTCEGLVYPTGIATDESGFIYVASHNTPKTYIISPNGEFSFSYTKRLL